MIYTLTPPYKHLTQKWDFCGATCLQMIFFRHGIWKEQESLAFDLGTHIQEKDKSRFTTLFETGNTGLRIVDFRGERIQSLLQQEWFTAQTVLFSEIKDWKYLEKLFMQSLSSGQDCMIAFHRWPIDPDIHHGHYVLLNAYDAESQQVSVCDPTPKTKNIWTIDIKILLSAMSSQRDRERWIVLIRK